MSDDTDDKLPPQGRLTRLRKLAGLSAQLGADVLKSGARRLAGQDPEFVSKATAEKLVATLGELKGAAMKIGQAISMDTDLLTPEVRQVIARLQNQAPPMGHEVVARVVKQELGAPPEELFQSFEAKPLAAASLGQVHRAVLKDGRAVAVKVQYPGIGESMAGDLDNLGAVVKTVGRTSRLMDGTAYYRELREELMLELDYRREAELCNAFAESVARLPHLCVPRAVREYTASRVLTLELLEGPTLKEWVTHEHSPEERFRVSRLLTHAIIGPFLLTGEIHADPHPGNFLVMGDGRLGLLDFGAIKRFSPRFVQAHRHVVLKALRNEPVDGLALVREVGFTVELPDAEATPLLSEILEIAGRPIRQVPYDYATCTITPDMKRHFAQNAGGVLRIRPPAEAVQFFRATGGLTQNLRLVGARGDFRAVYQELMALL